MLRTISLSLLIVGALGVARAQDPQRDLRHEAAPQAIELSHMSMSATPEMWFYEQERQRHDDPKQAVRRNAEQQAAERRERLAASQWYGMNNMRPTASNSPLTGSYSPYWGSNSSDPMRWRPATPLMVQRPAGFLY